MKPLIDGDILRYEIGFSGEINEVDDDGVKTKKILNFEQVAELLDNKINLICGEVGASEAPTIFLTGDKYLYERHLKKPYIPNFREAIAVTKDYKANRKSEKPFHFYNITEYMLATYNVKISQGLEADDEMCIEQYEDWQKAYKVFNELEVEEKDYNSFRTIICSRDKDLRMCPGLHYSWECGKQSSIGPYYVTDIGYLERKEGTKIFGCGLKFFFFQTLAGDTVDNIPGIKGLGNIKAHNIINSLTTEKEMFKVVSDIYKATYKDDWKKNLKEQIDLLWMIRELDEHNKPKFYNPVERDIFLSQKP
jgi:hypothetical protein